MDKKSLAMKFLSTFGWLATFFLICMAVND